MPVAADQIEIRPTLEEARALAAEHSVVPLRHTFIADTETPVSAYLKLRGAGPSFLLESAEGGQRVGRWSFLGVHPRAVMRLDEGVLTVDGEQRPFEDPYTAVSEELARYRAAPLADLPPFAGAAPRSPPCRRAPGAGSACSAPPWCGGGSRRSAAATTGSAFPIWR